MKKIIHWLTNPAFHSVVFYNLVLVVLMAVGALLYFHSLNERVSEKVAYVEFARASSLFDDKHESCFREFSDDFRDWHPLTYYANKPYRGDCLNIDEKGERITLSPSKKAEWTIWLFGGSTAFGVVVRDEETIASRLAAHLQAKGIAAKVRNLGQPGYNSLQEMLYFLEKLRAGERADMAIFFDGVNEVLAGFDNDAAKVDPSLPFGEPRMRAIYRTMEKPYEHYGELLLRRGLLRGYFTKQKNEWMQSHLFEPPHIPKWHDPEKLAAAIAENYRFNIQSIASLGRRFDVTTLFILQPQIFSKRNPSDEEKKIQAAFQHLKPIYERFYRLVENEKGANLPVINLSDIFGEKTKTLYFDWSHNASLGHDIIGRGLADIVIAEIKAQSASQHREVEEIEAEQTAE